MWKLFRFLGKKWQNGPKQRRREVETVSSLKHIPSQFWKERENEGTPLLKLNLDTLPKQTPNRLEVNAFEFHFIHYIFFSHTHCLNVSELEMLFAILVKFWAQSHSCLKELWPKLFLYCTSAQVRIPHQSMEAMLAIGMLRFRRQCRSCLYAPIIGNVAVAGCLYAPTAPSRPQKTHVGLFTAIVGIVGLWRDIVLG